MVQEANYLEEQAPLLQSLGRIQSQIQALMELEKNWTDDFSMEQLQELISRKNKLVCNIESLLSNQKNLEKEMMLSQGGQLPEQYQSYRDRQVTAIRQMLENIIGLHQKHEEVLKKRSEKLRHSVEDVQQALTMLKGYQLKTNQQGLRIDLAG